MLGYSYQKFKVDYLTSFGEGIAPGITSVNGSANRQTSYARSQYWIDGYFLQQTFGWDNKLFLTERAGLTILLSLVRVRGIRNIPKPV